MQDRTITRANLAHYLRGLVAKGKEIPSSMDITATFVEFPEGRHFARTQQLLPGELQLMKGMKTTSVGE